MEEVLDIYIQPYNPKRPQICLDEKPYALYGDIIEPLKAQSGKKKRIDPQYKHGGFTTIFGLIEPLTGKQYTDVRKHRTALDFAEVIKRLVNELYPEAEKIVLVLDNLNTHVPASLYKRYEPAEARRILDKIEFHYTPKHGSWLNIAEIGLNLFTKQCLAKRMNSIEQLTEELDTWCEWRNQAKIAVNWHFTTKDARTKLRSLYPDVKICN